ncbi:MAG: ATP-binding protein [Nostoc sp. DedQUE12b]|uniref:ATP-binding protein n=1 Tax=Nostoc sp. DedQUE12b TaxID=3075398 RepID=UPI002AD51012|nr:ATP-binding protein [Nostoc sp. DedQUE12b]MDZ8086832.1 ATP-binding protein [Nostoc sp. DedQUE12b]
MKISQKLISGILGIATLSVITGAINAHQQLKIAKYIAQQEAEEVAGLVAYFVSHELDEYHEIGSRDKMLAELQDHVISLHKKRQHALEIVDRNKIILADVVPEDIGTRLDRDRNNEVGKTIQDGIPRIYIEFSPEYPNGIRLIAVPFKTAKGETVGAVILEYTPLYEVALATAKKNIVATSVISLVCGILALLLGYLISRSISKPIKQLQQAVVNLTEGKLDTRVNICSQDEIGELATSFNKMADDLQHSRDELVNANEQLRDEIVERQQTEAELQQALKDLQKTQIQLIQSEKMSSLGQLVAGVAHEINNPVNFIYGNLQHTDDYTQQLLLLIKLYQNHYPNPEPEIKNANEEADIEYLIEDLPKMLTSMKMGAKRIREIVLSLRIFSRLDEAEFKTADLHEGIDSTLLILQHRLKLQNNRPEIKVIKEYGEIPQIQCFAGQMNQVFMNILANAIDALEDCFQKELCPNPLISISSEQVNENVIIRIADNGIGIPKEIQLRLFDPFFTTKPVGKGTGMGLSISYQIITDKHGGSLQCISSPGQGAEFVITIPIRVGKPAQLLIGDRHAYR